MNTYIYKTKKYIIAQILWDLAGVCLGGARVLLISPLVEPKVGNGRKNEQNLSDGGVIRIVLVFFGRSVSSAS